MGQRMISVETIPDAFSALQCERLIAISKESQTKDAKLVGQSRDHNIRRSDLTWLDEVEGTDWVMERIIDVVRDCNRRAFNFDLTEFAESAQIARYGAEREGHFDWHSDIGGGHFAGKRKLTIVVQLSEAEAYDGGVLEVQPSTASMSAQKERGSATVFPSYLLHRVTPVRRGERYSLTVWSHGPAFR